MISLCVDKPAYSCGETRKSDGAFFAVFKILRFSFDGVHAEMTNAGGADSAQGNFPATRLSVIEALRSPEQAVRARAMELVVDAYWKPVYKYARLKRRCSPEDSQDLTQGFFVRVLEKNFFADYDSSKARFRTFLRTCLDRFASNEEQARTRIKRGGTRKLIPLDFADAEAELARSGSVAALNPEEYFEREWIRSVFARAVENLRIGAAAQGKSTHMRIFEQYDLDSHPSSEKVTYERLAKEYGLSRTDITNYLAEMRRQFREEVLDLLRGLTANDEEFRQEARSILGIDPG